MSSVGKCLFLLCQAPVLGGRGCQESRLHTALYCTIKYTEQKVTVLSSAPYSLLHHTLHFTGHYPALVLCQIVKLSLDGWEIAAQRLAGQAGAIWISRKEKYHTRSLIYLLIISLYSKKLHDRKSLFLLHFIKLSSFQTKNYCIFKTLFQNQNMEFVSSFTQTSHNYLKRVHFLHIIYLLRTPPYCKMRRHMLKTNPFKQ